MSTVYALAESPHEVALCDICDERPGTVSLIVCGLETWVCDRCRGSEEEESTTWLEAQATRARGLARQATEERQRLERMLSAAKQKERVACELALKAEAATMTTTGELA